MPDFNPYTTFSQQRRRPAPRAPGFDGDYGYDVGPGLRAPGSPLSFGASTMAPSLRAPSMPAPLSWNDKPEQRANFAASLERTRAEKAIDTGKAETFRTGKASGMGDAEARSAAQGYSNRQRMPQAPGVFPFNGGGSGGSTPAPNVGSYPFVAPPGMSTSTIPGSPRSAPNGGGQVGPVASLYGGSVGNPPAPITPSSIVSNPSYQAPIKFTPEQLQFQERGHKTGVDEAFKHYSILKKDKFADPSDVEAAKSTYDTANNNRDSWFKMRGGNTGQTYSGPTPTGAPVPAFRFPFPTQAPGQFTAAPGQSGSGVDKTGIAIDPATAQSIWHSMQSPGTPITPELRDQFAHKMGEYGISPQDAHGLLNDWESKRQLQPPQPAPRPPNWTPTVDRGDGHGGIYQDPFGQRIVVGPHGQRVGAPLATGLPAALPTTTEKYAPPSRNPIQQTSTVGNAAFQGGQQVPQATQPATQPISMEARAGDVSRSENMPVRAGASQAQAENMPVRAGAAQPQTQTMGTGAAPRLKVPPGGSENGDGTITYNGAIYSPANVNGQWNWKKQ